jgi:hypothetical protein
MAKVRIIFDLHVLHSVEYFLIESFTFLEYLHFLNKEIKLVRWPCCCMCMCSSI